MSLQSTNSVASTQSIQSAHPPKSAQSAQAPFDTQSYTHKQPSERPHDLRVIKTIDTIHSTFKELLLHTPLDSITVTDLCAQARINKKTFYRYYPTLQHLIAELQEEYVQGFLPLCAGLHFPKDAAEIARVFLQYSTQQDRLYEIITCQGMHNALREEMIDEVSASTAQMLQKPTHWNEAEWEIYLAFAYRTPLHMYQRWIETGKQISAQDLINQAVAVINAGSQAFIDCAESTH